METLCTTGIRISELRYITVEAAETGKAEASLKGKIRTILIPGKLCRKLQKYARKNKIVSGEIFLTRSGKALSRKQIWAEIEGVCGTAGAEPGKVFPHNLRHLFARTFYKVCRDVARLADVLGHSSMETTRIYLISTGTEHARTLEHMRLIS
jgi:integrase/recombinase XerD